VASRVSKRVQPRRARASRLKSSVKRRKRGRTARQRFRCDSSPFRPRAQAERRFVRQRPASVPYQCSSRRGAASDGKGELPRRLQWVALGDAREFFWIADPE